MVFQHQIRRPLSSLTSPPLSKLTHPFASHSLTTAPTSNALGSTDKGAICQLFKCQVLSALSFMFRHYCFMFSTPLCLIPRRYTLRIHIYIDFFTCYICTQYIQDSYTRNVALYHDMHAHIQVSCTLCLACECENVTSLCEGFTVFYITVCQRILVSFYSELYTKTHTSKYT